MRAVRLLHELEIAGKKLVAKVDAKNKLLLDNYKAEEKQSGNERPETEKIDDDRTMEAIRIILKEHIEEIGPTDGKFINLFAFFSK